MNEEQLSELVLHLGLGPLIGRLGEGLNSNVGERGNLLSGGEKQRILIARCLCADKSFVILDEPTSALDHESEERVFELLKKIKGKKTIVLASHRPRLLELADHIYSIEGGRVNALY